MSIRGYNLAAPGEIKARQRVARGRRIASLLVTLVVSTGQLLLVSPEAQALENCQRYEQIFVKSTSSAAFTHGTKQKIWTHNRDLTDPSTCNFPKSVSMAHMNKDVNPGGPLSLHLVEGGWSEFFRNGIKVWEPFTQWAFGTGSVRHFFPDLASDSSQSARLEQGTYDVWRITGTFQSPGSYDWDLEVNLQNGTGVWIHLRTYTTGWYDGYSLGEDESFGSDTGLAGQHRNLEKWNGSAWGAWPGANCVQDSQASSTTYEWDPLSDNDYDIVHQGTAC